MHIKYPEKRLSGFVGRVDEKHILSFVHAIKGRHVLDVGCGMGTTTGFINAHCKDKVCTGIDIDAAELEKAEKMFPESKFVLAGTEKLPFDDGAFDTIIIRDALHHLYEESDMAATAAELRRVAHKRTRLIILDPNVTASLRIMRMLAMHKDAECKYHEALQVVSQMGFAVRHTAFHTLYSLPLSGGYVGVNLVPRNKKVYASILGTERFFEKLLRFLHIEKYFCLRYLIIADRK